MDIETRTNAEMLAEVKNLLSTLVAEIQPEEMDENDIANLHSIVRELAKIEMK